MKSPVLIGLLAFLLYGSPAKADFKVVHFNIKELDSTKVKRNTPQLRAALEILGDLNGDFVSLNEIQYDLPGVPSNSYQSNGRNLFEIGRQIGSYDSQFTPAHTGKKAKRLDNGTYTTDTRHPDWRELADHVNFGLFPAEYSTGLLYKTKFEVIQVQSHSQIKWREFEPGFHPSDYKDATGSPYPEDIELFDKSFVDVSIEVEGRIVHFVLLHTVPAFNFGNPNGFNPERNAAQLRFLKYYLTGELSSKDKAVSPHLDADATFVAMGDWNVDRDKSELEGAKVLKQLGAQFNYWIDKRVITYESQNFSPNPFASQLDYILTSSDLEVVPNTAKVHRFPERKELGCKGSDSSKGTSQDFVVVSYRSGDKTCYVQIPKRQKLSKEASDHYAISAKFSFRD